MVQGSRTRLLVAVVLILTAAWIAMVVYVGVHLFGVFHVGLSSCLPADFPHYPRATLSSVAVSDSLGNCTTQYQTRDSTAEVQTFFKTDLNEGDWTVTGVNDGAGFIRFERRSRPQTFGYVKVLRLPGQPTQFQIQIRAR